VLEAPAIAGELAIVQEPDPDGSLGAGNTIDVSQIEWTSPNSVYLLDLPEGLRATAALGASVTAEPGIEMEDFTLPLELRDLVRLGFESLAMPSALLPEIDGFVSYYEILLDCAALGADLEAEIGALPASGAETACESFQAAAGPAVDAWIAAAATGATHDLVVGTRGAAACPIGLDAGQVTAMGGPAVRCVWQGELRDGGGGPALPATVDWWASRR